MSLAENPRYAQCPACREKAAPAPVSDEIETKAAERKLERERKALLKKEMKALAKKAREKKVKHIARVNQKKALKKLIPAIADDGPPVDPVQQELARRELYRRRLIEFVKAFHPRYKAGWVHYDICKRLEQFSRDVADGKSPRLMLLMPPRHGKSQLASKLWPAWHLGHHPEHEYIGCSYNISLALDFSREVRDVIDSDKYQKVFPGTKLNAEFRSAESWRLRNSTGVGAGGYNAAGVGGGITGKGAHILVIDDPVKNIEEADSQDMRQKIWDWYTSAAYTRLAPGGGVLVIQTCWHDDDLAGRLKKAMKEDPEADQFEIVRYPAIAETDEEFRKEGDPLHEDRYDLLALQRIKRTLSHRQWSALYQQDPITEEGAYFSRDMFIYRDAEPEIESLHIYQAWDFAISEKKQNDWTVGVTIGVDFTGMGHVLEVRRFKTNNASLIAQEMVSMYQKYRSVAGFGAEDGQIWRAMKSTLQDLMRKENVWIPLDDRNILKPLTDKLVRARPLQARMQNRQLTFPRGKEWVDVLMSEFLRFPGGANDDQVDALAWCAQLMVGKQPPRKVLTKNAKVEKTVAQKIRDLAKGGGSIGHMAA